MRSLSFVPLCKFSPLVVGMLLWATLACQQTPPTSHPTYPQTAGLHTLTLPHDGQDREFLLYLPADADSLTALPVMLNFHGYGGEAADHLAYTDMRPIADTAHFLLIYPQGSLLGKDPHWNAGLDTEENKSDADDVGFVEALLELLQAHYPVDTERVYACGYSNGSFFSYALACYMSDYIAAIGSVSGTMLEETYQNCQASRPVPMINLHGTADFVVPYEGSAEGLTGIPEVIDYWVAHNQTSDSALFRSFMDGGTTIEQYVYPNGTAQTSVEHYKILDGGHDWFDLDVEGANTSELIWNFVARYDLNGRR